MNKLIKDLTRILTVVFTTLLIFFIAANDIAGAYASTINRVLKIRPFITVNSEDDDTDTAYFKSAYSTNTFDPETGLAIYTQEGVDKLIKDAEKTCVEVEGEGLVLLKNENNALPLASGNKVSLFGCGSAVFNYSSTGSSETSSAGLADLKTALESVNLGVNSDLWNFYTKATTPKDKKGDGYGRTQTNINEVPWDLINNNSGSTFASYGDAAIVVFSRTSGEGADVPAAGTDGADGNYLALSQEERDMLTNLTALKKSGTFKKIILILNMANTMQLDFLADGAIDVDACMWVGNVGKTGIYAVAQTLTGEIVPSGRLSDTYVYDNFSSPAMASWALNEGRKFAQKYTNVANKSLNNTQSNYGVYVEGIYLGYRYYETRYEDVVLGTSNVGNYNYSKVVAYPFGHGLSYAEFEYSDFKVVENGDLFDISVKVTNTSKLYDGKEVVQIYLQKPYDASTGLETASVELVGFDKTGVLAKNNGSETVTIHVPKEQFASYDVNANGGKGGYVLEKGNYYLSVGTDAHDALNNILKAKSSDGVNIDASKMTADGDAKFTYRWSKNDRDESSYARSKETGNLITNQLGFADINRYENRGDNNVKYVSRSNWTGTWPTQAIKLMLTPEMINDLAVHKPLPTDTDDVMPTYGASNGLSLPMLRSTEENKIEYNDLVWDDFLDQMTFEQQSKLLTSAAFGTTLIEEFNKPETKDDDGPTAVVTSKNGISFPSEGIWASSFNTELIKKVGELLAEDALNNGITSLYATGINIHRTPYGGRAHEYFSEDPFLTGVAVCNEVDGMQGKGVIPTLKHFAFNDEEDQRGGVCIWLNEQEAREIMLKPFEMAMRPSKGKAHAIMTSFNRAGCIWTSASSELMINIAREEWGFDGYSITDMAEAFKFFMVFDDGIMNGTDTFLSEGDEYSLSDYAYSIPFRLRVRESCHRVLYVIANYSAAMNGISSSSKMIPVMPWWQAALYAGISVTAVLTAVGGGLWIASYVLDLINNKKENDNENK